MSYGGRGCSVPYEREGLDNTCEEEGLVIPLAVPFEGEGLDEPVSMPYEGEGLDSTCEEEGLCGMPDEVEADTAVITYTNHTFQMYVIKPFRKLLYICSGISQIDCLVSIVLYF